MKSKLDETIKEAINYNITECVEMAEAFDQTGVQATEEVSRCVTFVTNDVNEHKKHIEQRLKTVLKNLEDIKKEAELCVKHVTNIISSVQALVCVNRVGSLSLQQLALTIYGVIYQIN